MFNLAQQQIFERYKHPLFSGTVASATHTAEGANPLCGDEVVMTMVVNNENVITDIQHQSRACAICTASADLLSEQLHEKPLDAVAQVSTKDVQDMIGIPLSPLRLKCALLPLETLKLAITSS